MKKLVVLLFCMTLPSTLLLSQINDENWELVFDEDFTINRWWDTNTFKEQCSDISYQQRWDCMSEEWWPYRVTTGEKSHQAYQPSHARFGSDHKLRLVAECMSTTTPLSCEAGDYIRPDGALCSYYSSTMSFPLHNSIFYYSGTIETTRYDNWFGYYEVKCQLPSHPGEGSAVWLFGKGDNTYEEIDIFEQSKYDAGPGGDGGMDTICSCGIWYNSNGTNYYANDHDPDSAKNFCKNYIYAPSDNDFSQEHIFALKWHPDSIIWYLDGQEVNSCRDRSMIPQSPLRLKITHSVKEDAISYDTTFTPTPTWIGSDEMVVDYIRYYRLKTDCGTDLVIDELNDWNQCLGVKKSITIDPDNDFIVPNNCNKCLIASDSITITRGTKFTIPLGSKVTFMIHECVNYEDANTNNNN